MSQVVYLRGEERSIYSLTINERITLWSVTGREAGRIIILVMKEVNNTTTQIELLTTASIKQQH